MRKNVLICVATLSLLAVIASDASAFGRRGCGGRRRDNVQCVSTCPAATHHHHAAPARAKSAELTDDNQLSPRPPEQIGRPRQQSAPKGTDNDEAPPRRNNQTSLPGTLPTAKNPEGETIYILTPAQYQQYQKMIQQQ